MEEYLTPLGVNINTLNPDHINIYGNGDGRLPELNSAPRTDDLAKNAIQIVGGEDGSFDFGDSILFYGWGPNRTSVSGGELTQDRNTYSNVSCYFINVNTTEPPLRIASIPNSSDPITHSISDYSFFQKYETEAVSLVNGGKRFYGELFDVELSQTFTLGAPNIVSSTPASVKVFFATNASSTEGNFQSYSVNGAQISSLNLPTVAEGFRRSSEQFQVTNPTSSMAVQVTITRSSPAVLTYLDYIEMNARRGLFMVGNQFNFRDLPSVGAGNVGNFSLTGISSNGFVWDVTDRHVPKLIEGTTIGSAYEFRANLDSLREFVASNGTFFFYQHLCLMSIIKTYMDLGKQTI